MEIDGTPVKKITSKLFTANSAERVNMPCRKWYGAKDDNYADLAIPYKEAVTNSKGDKVAKVLTCDCLRDTGKDYYEELNSLTNPEFAPIVNDERFSDLFTRESLQKAFRTGSNKAAKERAQADRTTYALMEDWLQTTKNSFTDSFEELVNTITR